MGETGKIKMRVLVGLWPDDTVPSIIGALDDTTYEVIPDDEWQRIIAGWKQGFSVDHASYDYAEVTITVPSHELASLFQHGELVGSVESDELPDDVQRQSYTEDREAGLHVRGLETEAKEAVDAS